MTEEEKLKRQLAHELSEMRELLNEVAQKAKVERLKLLIGEVRRAKEHLREELQTTE